MQISAWNHKIAYKLLALDRNTWNFPTMGKKRHTYETTTQNYKYEPTINALS